MTEEKELDQHGQEYQKDDEMLTKQINLLHERKFNELDVDFIIDELRDMHWWIEEKMIYHLTEIILNKFYLSRDDLMQHGELSEHFRTKITEAQSWVSTYTHNDSHLRRRMKSLINDAYEQALRYSENGDYLISLHGSRCPWTLQEVLSFSHWVNRPEVMAKKKRPFIWHIRKYANEYGETTIAVLVIISAIILAKIN